MLRKVKIKNPSISAEKLNEMYCHIDPPLSVIEKTHVMFINGKYKPFVLMTHEYSKTIPKTNNTRLGSTFSFKIPKFGEFVNDAAVHIKLTGLRSISPINKVRYTEFLGHRLMKKVKMLVCKNLIDEYGTDEYNSHWQYKVPVNKEAGYLRNIGQEQPKRGFLTADPINDEVREYKLFGDGPQTYKVSHDSVELWIPLLFWFSNIETALPNALLNTEQTEVEITFEKAENLISFANYGGEGTFVLPKVESCYLYVNHLFMTPEIFQLFAKKVGFQLIRVHKKHTQELVTNTDNVKLQQLKWPIESLYITFKPKENISNTQKWFRNTLAIQRSVPTPVVTAGNNIQINNALYYDEYDPVASLELTASDIIIYPETKPSFYNNYIPYRYGDTLKTPKDIGNYMMNFNLKPGEYQPSGHFNISRSRELYLRYVSALNPDTGENIIDNESPSILTVQADCINFIIINDGSIVLRYST